MAHDSTRSPLSTETGSRPAPVSRRRSALLAASSLALLVAAPEGLARVQPQSSSTSQGQRASSLALRPQAGAPRTATRPAPVRPRSAQLPGSLAASDQHVIPPPLWYSGDTHEHLQRCAFPPDEDDIVSGSIPAVPIDDTELDIYTGLVRDNLNVAAVSFWRPFQNTETEFFDDYVPRVTGTEDASTLGDANHILQFGVETSGFATSIRGHLLALGVSDGNFDPEVPYPAPNLDFFRAQPGALAGYAHQAWPNDLTNPAGWLGVDYQCLDPVAMDFPNVVALWGAAAQVYAPMDAAFRRLDFLETVDLELNVPGNISWTGMWYRLLTAGIPVQAVAGTDTNCFTTVSRDDPRTWVQIDSDPLTFDKWVDGIREGNLSMSMGPSVFLELQVDGQPAGSQVYIDSTDGLVQVTAALTVAPGVSVSDTIEILVDGIVVGSLSVSNVTGDTQTYLLDVPLTESSWIAARTSSLRTHTGFVEAFVDAEPITDCDSNEYWVLYAEYLEWFLDLATSQGMVEDFVGDREAEIRAYIQDGAEVFALHRAYDLDLPPGGVLLSGPGTPSCEGPMGLVTRATALDAGTTVRIEVFDAPALGTGWLMVGANGVPAGYDQNGAITYVATDASTVLYDVTVDERGVAFVDLTLPALAGLPLYAQFIFPDAPDCPGTDWSSSEALRIFAQ